MEVNDEVMGVAGRPQPRAAAPSGERWIARVFAASTSGDVVRALAVVAAASALLRLVLSTVSYAPVVFSDELGYTKLAQSIGLTGQLALFNQHGLSYSPLYPTILAPIFALGASAPTAYFLTHVVNACLMSLSVFPTYMVARSVLPRRPSLLVAALSAAAPLMFYSSLTMSENVAYPVCLTAIWAMLEAIRRPSFRHDAILLGAIVLAVVARAQLAILLPAALTAIVIVAALDRDLAPRLRRRLLSAVDLHRLLFGVVAAALLCAGAAALAGRGVYDIFGRYAVVGRASFPGFGRILKMLAWHLAGIDLAVGVVPFVGAIVATVALARSGFPRRALPFAAVAASVTTWMWLEVGYDSATFDVGEIPRIHERFLIYVVPFFLVALLATVRIPEAFAARRTYLLAIGAGALLLLAIPYHTVVNQTSAVDTFSLQPLAHPKDGRLVAIPGAAAIAVVGAILLGILFLNVRRQMRATVILTLIPLVLISGQELSRIASGSRFTRSLLPAKTNWVDAAKPHGTVVLLTGAEDPTPALETAYSNLSISRLYYLCAPAAGSEFGERPATVSPSGRLQGPEGDITAAYAVAPTRLDVQGRVIARNPMGQQVLVALSGGRLQVPSLMRDAASSCAT